MMNAIQTEIRQWHLRNYPTDDLESALLGLGEEIGELMRAQLKQDGGIRGTWEEWQNEKFKEAGDVMIGLINCCGFMGVDAFDSKTNDGVFVGTAETAKGMLLEVGVAYGNLTNHCEDQLLARCAAGNLFRNIEDYCILVNICPTEALEKRWQTISARDFIANPASGGRETET